MVKGGELFLHAITWMCVCLHLDVGLCACVRSNVDVGLWLNSHSLMDFHVNLLRAFLSGPEEESSTINSIAQELLWSTDFCGSAVTKQMNAMGWESL